MQNEKKAFALNTRHTAFEQLEPRQMMSATTGVEDVRFFPMGEKMSPMFSLTPVGFTPDEIRSAYGFEDATVEVGDDEIELTGAGTTIAIVAAYSNPNIRADLRVFNEEFDLPQMTAQTFRIVNQTGGGNLPPPNLAWATEIALDVQWAHALAPGARILLVCANSDSARDLYAAVDYAKKQAGVVVVSNSWGGAEFRTETRDDFHFVTPAGHTGVTFVFSAGDVPGVSYPAASPNVLSVGGSSLVLDGDDWSAETPWASSGGGLSLFQGVPSYQRTLGVGSRATPDVTFVGDNLTGVAVYDSFATGGWLDMGGSSVGAPAWSAIIAVATHGRRLVRKAPLANAQVAMYAIERASFRDLGAPGYDVAAGLGSPVVDDIVDELIAFNGSTKLPPAFPPPGAPTGARPNGTWWWSGFFPMAVAGDKHLAQSIAVGSSVTTAFRETVGLQNTLISTESTLKPAAANASKFNVELKQIVWSQAAADAVESELRASRRNRFAQHPIVDTAPSVDSFFAKLK